MEPKKDTIKRYPWYAEVTIHGIYIRKKNNRNHVKTGQHHWPLYERMKPIWKILKSRKNTE